MSMLGTCVVSRNSRTASKSEKNTRPPLPESHINKVQHFKTPRSYHVEHMFPFMPSIMAMGSMGFFAAFFGFFVREALVLVHKIGLSCIE